jgi:hypothetical protein
VFSSPCRITKHRSRPSQYIAGQEPGISDFASYPSRTKTNPSCRPGSPKSWKRRFRKPLPNNSEKQNSAPTDTADNEAAKRVPCSRVVTFGSKTLAGHPQRAVRFRGAPLLNMWKRHSRSRQSPAPCERRRMGGEHRAGMPALLSTRSYSCV